MKIRSFFVLTLLSLAVAMPAAAQPGGEAPGLNVLERDARGIPSFVTGKIGILPKGDRGRAAAAFLKDFARKNLDARGTEDLEVRRVRQDDLGKLHVRTRQRINGLPVVGTELILHSDAKTGEVYAVNGRFIPDDGLPLEPRVAPEKALITAYITLGIQDPQVLERPELTYVVDTDEHEARLAWSVLVSYEDSEGIPQIDRIFADATVGGLVERHPQVHSVLDRDTHNANNDTTLPGTLAIEEGGTSTDNVLQTIHNHTGTAYNYYWGRFGRDSLNGAGMTLVSSGHYRASYNNAHWNGTQMYYGDGDGSRFSPLGGALDIVAHEMTHGVTDFESDLVYQNESGALNESLSDIFGATVEAWADGAISADTWKIGEDVFTPGTAGDALRYMDNPTLDGASKDYYPERYTGTDDLGGVHWNSGISNLAFQRLVAGGRHPRNKNYQYWVSSIGLNKAEAIFYRAQTVYLGSNSDFAAMRTATIQAAADLYPSSTFERNAVRMAWCVVGVFANDCPPMDISGSGTTFAGRRMASLSWASHMTGVGYDVFRNGVKIATTANKYYSDSFSSTATSANYWACTAGRTSSYDTNHCTNVTTVSFATSF